MSKSNYGKPKFSSNTIPREVKKFAKADYKKFKKDLKKKNGDDFKKKEIRLAFCEHLLKYLPDTIEYMVRFGHINNPDIQEAKEGAYERILYPRFIKFLKKELKSGTKIDNINLLPIIIAEISKKVDETNRLRAAENSEVEPINIDDLLELARIILTKRKKKLVKAGINENLSYDLLSVIPTNKAMTISTGFRIKSFFNVLYAHAKEETIPFEDIIETLIDETYYASIVVFALLERKKNFAKLDEKQKVLYLAISNWCFKTMERNSSKNIKLIIDNYVKARKKDDNEGNDEARRYSLSSLSEADYPRVAKVVSAMIESDPEIKKYM